MVDLILRVHGAGAGDDVVAPRQRLGADEFQQQAGDCPVVVPEEDAFVCQCLHRALIEHLALGRDGREQPQLFRAHLLGAGQQAGAQPLDVAAHFFKVCAARFGAAAVQQQAARRGHIPRRPAAQQLVAGKQGGHLVLVGVQGIGVNGVVQTQHPLVCAGGFRLHHMGRGGVDDGAFLPQEHHPVQTVGVAGAVDALDRFALILCGARQTLHQSRLAAARPAFEQHQLHPGLPAQRRKVALEPGGRCSAQKEIHRRMHGTFHTKTPHFCFTVCKSGAVGSCPYL